MPSSLIQPGREIVHRLAFLTRFSAWRSRSRRCVRLLMLHEVGGSGYPLELFEQQLRYLTRHFTVSPLPEILARLRNDTIAGDEVVLTFNDGLESHGTRVYPVLERLRLPAATFFVCPGLIERGEGIWTLETRARLAVLPPAEFLAWVRENGLPDRTDVDGALAWMKRLPKTGCLEVVARLRQLVGTGRDDGDRPITRLMSWEQLRSLDPGLVTIGSHSFTHSILTLLEPMELEREIGEAHELLAQRLGHRAQVFCYPEGALDARVVEVARRYYEATSSAGIIRASRPVPGMPSAPTRQPIP